MENFREMYIGILGAAYIAYIRDLYGMYLHLIRKLQYESFYLSQYILQFIIYKNGLSWGSRFTEQYICESFTSTVYSDILLYPLKHFKAHSDINENNQQCYERIA